MVTTLEATSSSCLSPQLQAKKALRDEKLQKLRDMMDDSLSPRGTAGESSSERPPQQQQQYVSYQHGGDVEQGHIFMINDGNKNGSMMSSQQPRLLREEINSLIYNADDATIDDHHASMLSRLDTKQKAIGTAALLVFLYMWL